MSVKRANDEVREEPMKSEIRIKATRVGSRVRVSMEAGFGDVISVGIGDDLVEGIAACLAVSSRDVAASWTIEEEKRKARDARDAAERVP